MNEKTVALTEHWSRGERVPSELEGYDQERHYFDGEPFARVLRPEDEGGHYGRFVVEPLGPIRELEAVARTYKSYTGPHRTVAAWYGVLLGRAPARYPPR